MTQPPSSEKPAADSHPSTARSPGAWMCLLLTIVLGVSIDLISKSLAFSHIAGIPVSITRKQVLLSNNLSELIPVHKPDIILPGFLELTLVLNPGAVFGIASGQRVVFIIFTLIAMVLGVIMFLRLTRPDEWLPQIAIGLLIAGGIGNLYDRIVFGCVRDFLHPIPSIWPWVSNIADLFLLIGIGVLFFHTMRLTPPPTPQQSES